MLPQLNAAENAVLIGDHGCVLWQLDGDLRGIAAADVDAVVIEEAIELVDGLAQPLVPLLAAFFRERVTAQVVFVGLAVWQLFA